LDDFYRKRELGKNDQKTAVLDVVNILHFCGGFFVKFDTI